MLAHYSSSAATDQSPAEDVDVARGGFYLLLARLLSAVPSAELLADLAARHGTGGGAPLEKALDGLFAAAGTAQGLEAEYNALFIGLAQGEVLPYGSHYLSGFLHDTPLAKLRDDMARLGVAADPDACEPEDHVAIVCDIMAGLILGRFGAPASLAAQRDFHDRHLGPWAGRFFDDLKAAPSAVFYRAVAELARAFFDIEAEAFALA